MRLRSNRFGLILCGILAVAVTGCPKEKPDASGGGGGGAEGGGGMTRIKIAVMPKGTKHQFWQSVKAGADKAGEEEHVDVLWVGPQNETDTTEQVNLVQTQVTNKVNGIVLAAQDKTALGPPLKAAMDKGIPVVTIDSGVEDKSASLCYIATDNVKGGEAAADELARLIGDKGKVGLLSFFKGAVSSDEREEGFIKGMKKHPNIKIISIRYSQSDNAKARDETINMLTANPDIAGIFASNEPNGISAANVLKDPKYAGKVKLVAYDSSDQEVEAIKAGTIQATVVQDPFQMGYLGVKTVLKAIRKQPINEKSIDSGFKLVTKENLDTPEIQKLINPPGLK